MGWEIDFYPEEEWINVPDLPEEKALLDDWKLVKPLFEDLQNDKYHLIKIIVGFRRIKEFSRRIPRKVCEEFTECLKANGKSRTFKNDINLMFKMAEIYQNFNKPIEAEKFYQKSLSLVLTEGHEVMLNLKDYIRLMAQLKRSEKCYETIQKLTTKYESYRYFLALALMELKAFEMSFVFLAKCPQESPTVYFSQIEVLYELKKFNMALDLCDNDMIEDCDPYAPPPELVNDKKQFTQFQTNAKGLFWIGKIVFAQKNYIDAWPRFVNMGNMIANFFRKKENIERPYAFKQIMLDLVPQTLEMMEECLKYDYKGIKAKYSGHFSSYEAELLDQFAFMLVNMAMEATEKHLNLKALTLVNFSKLLSMVCKIEPPHKCYTIWHHKCTLEVTMRLGMLDEATSEILAARVNQNKKLEAGHGVDKKTILIMMENILFMLYSRIRYYDEAEEIFVNLNNTWKESNLVTAKWAQMHFDGLGFRHATNLYYAQKHCESIELFKKHENFLETNVKEGLPFMWIPPVSYLHLGDHEKSMDALNRFMKMKGKRSNFTFEEQLHVIIFTGFLYRKKKDFKEAIRIFNKATDMGDVVFTPFHKMLTAYDRKNFKDYTKFMRQVIQRLQSLKNIVEFLQHLISHEERYLADEWRKILDIFVLHSRDIWPKPEKDFPRFRIYRTSSLLALHFVQKRVQCLNEK